MHRALVSLGEELEAIDWYQQRIEATEDGELRDILRHNRDEEMEHAAMLLEWIRRREPAFDERLRPRLFTQGNVLEVEETLEQKNSNGAGNGAAPSVGIGSLRRAERGK
jgi:ferritin-like protein